MHIDFLYHLQCVDIQLSKHLDFQCTMNYKFSNKHHELYEQDERDPKNHEKKKKNALIGMEILFKWKLEIEFLIKSVLPVMCIVEF